MRMRKRMVAFCFCSVLIGGSCTGLSANATTITRSTDNDPIADGYSYQCYNMNYYNGIAGAYNGDLRLSPSINGSNASYTWFYPFIGVNKTSCNVKLEVYLNNANFTDQNASYGYEIMPMEGTAGVGTTIGTINQKYAAGGWSTISKNVTSYPGNSYVSSRYVYVNASSGSNKQLGADGLKVTVTY